ncbi:FAD binding domain protein [Viridothelium virens]|uniref:FAD binding domain protein n=1 Tax=Viridothelium virens TaxID=1048519 RepID=A0A6A6GTK2_VIRVR|nr:FAD binding domain protein [Viridothelium virens]
MTFQLLSISATATLLLIIASNYILHYVRSVLRGAKRPNRTDLASNSTESTVLLGNSLASALPDSIIFPHDAAAFEQSVNSYWAQQECEVIPACIVRPRDVQQLCTAVHILKSEYDERGKKDSREKEKVEGMFAIRSGGHSPVSGAASIRGGVLIDLSLFHEVTPSEDGSSVVIGAGAKWVNVSKILDEKGLAVTGGRSSAVGVGGLTLGGGLSFFSPRFGLVCSNIISYEVVLASGCVATASATTNSDLWQALKGGSNNFGIVTRITARSFRCAKIWSGFLYLPAFQATKVLAAFHEFVNRANSGDHSIRYDSQAAGPIACFTYLQQLGIEAVAVNLVYTNTPEDGKKWPVCWRTSSFRSLWRLWSTCKVRTLTSATDELNALNPPGRRQAFGTTTIKNDPATLAAAHCAYRDAIASIRRKNIKGMSWTLVLQPLLPEWFRKGDPNPLGLQNDGTDEPLVIVSFTVNWAERQDDEFVAATTRQAVEQIEATATAKNTGHRYRYLNYCGEWQKPLEGYGEENLRFLREVARKYDPGGLFQKGCVGGFKLGSMPSEA